MSAHTAILADDEPLLRDMLKAKLGKLWPELSIVAEATNGAEALQHFEALEPDILFLDIHMRPVSGLQVAAAIDAPDMPVVVFVTAYDQYAITAFELNALDRLRAHVRQHPDATLQEHAAFCGVDRSVVGKALKKMKITRKKRPRTRVSRSGPTS